MPVKKQLEEGEKKGKGMDLAVPQRESTCAVSFVLRLLSLSLAGRNLRGDLMGRFQ